MDDLIAELARQIQGKYYGKYRGFVADNADPEKRGRLQLRIPSVLGDQTSAWALPCVPFGGLAAQGWFVVPEVDAQVWVEFEEGDVRKPVWTGTFWQKTNDVPERARRDKPTMRLLQTPSGHALELDDEQDKERLRLHHKSGAELSIDENGSVTLTDAKGARVLLDADSEKVRIEDSNGNTLTMDSTGTTVEDANGNRVEMAAAGVKVKGQQIVVEGTQVLLGGQGGEPVIKGQSFLTLFMTHVHPTSGPGAPTSPPVPQGELSTLSTTVMTK